MFKRIFLSLVTSIFKLNLTHSTNRIQKWTYNLMQHAILYNFKSSICNTEEVISKNLISILVQITCNNV